MYYNYHAKLRSLLETIPYKVIEETGEFAFRFVFDNGVSMPIREYRVEEYSKYLFK